jgi:hypothetical protein
MATVDIEYVGDPDILDEVTKFRIATGEILPQSANVMRAAAMQRSQVIEGITRRDVDPEWFGTSRKYVFGPRIFVVAVEEEDVDKILGSASGHQFRLVGHPGNAIIRPPGNFVMVSEVEGGLRDIYSR